MRQISFWQIESEWMNIINSIFHSFIFFIFQTDHELKFDHHFFKENFINVTRWIILEIFFFFLRNLNSIINDISWHENDNFVTYFIYLFFSLQRNTFIVYLFNIQLKRGYTNAMSVSFTIETFVQRFEQKFSNLSFFRFPSITHIIIYR